MFKNIINKIFKKKIGFFGKYISFDQALLSCDGYFSKNLIRHVYKQAKLAIKTKNYEQDGIIYNKPIINQFIIYCFLNYLINQKEFDVKKKFKILDYGGSFGNLFFSLKNFIHLNFDWTIIEQNEKVKLANKNKIFKNIKFKNPTYKSKKYDLVIFNTSFQYLPNPVETFKKLKFKNNKFIITNLTVSSLYKNYLKIEYPDPKVYRYTYPCWFFSEKYLVKNLFKNFRVKIFKIDNPPYLLNKKEKYINLYLEKK